MPATTLSKEEILAAFKTVADSTLFSYSRVDAYRRDTEDPKKFTNAAGQKMPTRNQILGVPPESVKPSFFSDRQFGHDRAHVEELALSLLEMGQREDAQVFLVPAGPDAYELEVHSGAGRRLACVLIRLSGVDPDFTLRVKVIGTLRPDDSEDKAAAMRSAVAENWTRANYSAIDKAHIFAQWTSGALGPVITQEEIARLINKEPAHVSQILKLRDLIPELQRLVHIGEVPYSRAINWARKLTKEQQAEIVSKLAGGKDDSGKDNGGPKPVTLKQLQVWCADVVNSTAHKEGSKRFCRILLDALTSHVSTINDVDAALEENTKAR